MLSQEKFMTVAEVAELLGCSKSTVWRRSSDRTLPAPVKIGCTTRWLMTEIAVFIEQAKSNRST